MFELPAAVAGGYDAPMERYLKVGDVVAIKSGGTGPAVAAVITKVDPPDVEVELVEDGSTQRIPSADVVAVRQRAGS
jgi:hypothetical protein